MASSSLEREYEYFLDHLKEMIRDHADEYVLLKVGEEDRFFPTKAEAVSYGYRELKEGFFVHQVAEPPIGIVATALSI